jgi:hypothetical protein
MINKIYLFSCLFAVTHLLGCSYATHYIPMDQSAFPPTNPSQVAVSSQEQLVTNHRVIGAVAVIVWGNGEDARAALQQAASRIGANAIIGLKLENSFFRTAASGTAVLLYR